MRDLKFRAWEPGIKRFTYFDIAYQSIPAEIYEDPQQYTGLKDKNGVEIYEGDLMTANGGKDIIEVNFYGGAFSAIRSDHKQGSPLISLGNGWEVIGNIRENPELVN